MYQVRILVSPNYAAVTWVYLINVLPLVLAAAVAARFFQVAVPVREESR